MIEQKKWKKKIISIFETIFPFANYFRKIITSDDGEINLKLFLNVKLSHTFLLYENLKLTQRD